MNSNWFAHILVHHPFIVLTAVAVFSGSCLIIPFTLKTFPDFSDPQMGFETRGTDIANRIVTWKNLLEATKPSGAFAVNPKEFSITYQAAKRNKTRKKDRIKTIKKIFISEEKNYTSRNKDQWRTLHELMKTKVKLKHDFAQILTDGFFCGPPDEAYVQIVLKSLDHPDLFTFESLLIMCRIEHEFIQAKYYKELCVQTSRKPKKCCRPWSLANYIALLNNRTSCLALTEEDVNLTRSLLQMCSQYYHNLQLGPDCSEKGHCEVPASCIRHDAIFNILNFLTSTSFLPPSRSNEIVLQETMIFLPIACSTAALPYYHEIEKLNLEYEGISVVAMEFGIKNALFNECLLRDSWLMTMGGIFVLFCIWLYTESIFLTIMTIIAIIFSLGISYFMYMLVFELRFFPFMNLLAAVVAIGIGADDAFIFCKMWNSSKEEKNSSLIKLMSSTFNHAFFSMFITSLTTAVAFLASYINSITAISCFSIFASIAVIANCILMMTWLPACVVISEKMSCLDFNIIKICFQKICCPANFQLPLRINLAWAKCKCTKIKDMWRNRERLLLNGIITFRYVWLVLFTTLAITSAIIVFYYPRLQLPNSPEFQLFQSSHPFEQYDMVYKNMFWFKRAQRENLESNSNYKLPLRFVWGVLPVDTGNRLDPNSLGKLKLDPSFDMSDPESQKWLLRFCRRLRKQPFYQPTLGPLLPNCFIESFLNWMQRRCLDAIDKKDRSPCCETENFPFNSTVFNICILQAISDLYETPSEYFIPGMAGPKFSKDQFPTIKAIVVEYDSTYSYSMSFEHMHQFFSYVENWMINELKTAPDSMKNGWFVSELEFYDLQKELSKCTFLAIVISMGLALAVLLLATLNILTSLYAIITITCSILVTMATLVLLGWKLNILESVAVSTAIGLTVDFSLHYAVNYKMCPRNIVDDRKSVTRYALSNMAGPASMAAITTGAAGTFMMPSLILAYIQIGTFLITVMSISWFYSTFYLGSILAVIGPQQYFGQYYYSSILCCSSQRFKKSSNETERNRPTSSSLCDTHELDSLNSKCGIRPSQRALHRSLSGGKNSQNRYIFADQSPSATSAITIIMPEDN